MSITIRQPYTIKQLFSLKTRLKDYENQSLVEINFMAEAASRAEPGTIGFEDRGVHQHPKRPLISLSGNLEKLLRDYSKPHRPYDIDQRQPLILSAIAPISSKSSYSFLIEAK